MVCVSETRLKNEPLLDISLPGYNFIHMNSNTQAGDVAMYISKNIRCKIHQNVTKKNFRLLGHYFFFKFKH